MGGIGIKSNFYSEGTEMKIAIHQPQYFPWLGYFDKMYDADIFVLLDTVQFKKNEWQNRNKIKTKTGWQWITVPVKHRFGQRICDVEICQDRNWRKKHLNAFFINYKKAMFFEKYWYVFDEIFNKEWQKLSTLNIHIIKKIKNILNINTPLIIASQMGDFPDEPDERIIKIVQKFKSNNYLAGSGGKVYMNLEKYRDAGINVIFQDYKHPVYQQVYDSYTPNLSIIDLILNYGNRSLEILLNQKVLEYEYISDRRSS